MKNSLVAALLLLGLLFVLPAVPAAREPARLRVGAARVDITPDFPIALQGYLDPELRISTGVHDPLYARAIALASGNKRVVVLTADLAGFIFAPYFTRLIAERWGLREDEILLCGTHTHSAPQLSLNADYPHPNNLRYTRSLERMLVDVTGRALQALAPATMAFGRGRATVGMNRRSIQPDGRVEMAPNPDGPADPEVQALRFARPGGAPFAVLFSYASHARSLRRPNTLVSGDIFGIAEQVVERSAGAKVIAAAVAGASGDVDPAIVVDSFDTPDGSTPPTVALGTQLGEEAARAAREASSLPSRTTIRTASARLQLPPKIAGQAKYVTASLVTMGDVALVGLDSETSVEIGLAIKRRSPFPMTIVITICNGVVGYLPTAQQHAEGGYEVGLTPFGPAAGDALVEQTVTLLKKLQSGTGL